MVRHSYEWQFHSETTFSKSSVPLYFAIVNYRFGSWGGKIPEGTVGGAVGTKPSVDGDIIEMNDWAKTAASWYLLLAEYLLITL